MRCTEASVCDQRPPGQAWTRRRRDVGRNDDETCLAHRLTPRRRCGSCRTGCPSSSSPTRSTSRTTSTSASTRLQWPTSSAAPSATCRATSRSVRKSLGAHVEKISLIIVSDSQCFKCVQGNTVLPEDDSATALAPLRPYSAPPPPPYVAPASAAPATLTTPQAPAPQPARPRGPLSGTGRGPVSGATPLAAVSHSLSTGHPGSGASSYSVQWWSA